MKPRQQSGFSLIELIMVTVIFAIAAVPILGQFTQIASSTLINEDIQTASQLAQERAESVLAVRRDQGYTAITLGATNDVLTGDYAGFSRSVIVSEASSTSVCASSTSCKRVVVTVDDGLRERAEIVYVLVDY